MNKFFLLLIAGLVLGFSTSFALDNNGKDGLMDPFDHIIAQVDADTLPLPPEREGDFITSPTNNPFDLQDPDVINQQVEYDPITGQYFILEKIGDNYIRTPNMLTLEEYLEYSEKKQRQEYFDQLARNSSGPLGGGTVEDPISKVDIPQNLLDKLFGGTKIDIRPQGNIELTLGADFQKVDNPIIPERQRTQGGFNFDMAIQMNVTGQIGEKLKLGTSYNTQATFNFDNQMKLEYAGGEDDIIKKIEAGNVSLPLRSSLIQGSQSLFGIKTELQFGRLTLTGVASQQRSKRNSIQIQGGSQLQTFDVPVDRYDENRHFFFTHYNRDGFERSLQNLPQIQSLFRINRIEVWVTNTRNQTENVRDIVALADLAEGDPARITNTNPFFQPPGIPASPDISGQPLPTNDANPMLDVITSNPASRYIDAAIAQLSGTYDLQQAKDFEKVRARMLNPNEYTVHPELGFVSLNVTLQPEDVLGVAFEYTYNGQVYKVGELSNDVPVNPDTLNVLYVKMLKSTTPRVDIPMWDLMMKNIYSIGAFQVSREDFLLDIFYEDPGGGERRFIEDSSLPPSINGVPLLNVFNLDNLNAQGDPRPDGRFDFVDGVTITTRNGRIMFPVLEPFGKSLEDQIGDPILASQYSYPMLYDSTVTIAQQFPEFNRFTIRGSYKSSVSSEISLGAFNIPKGSVVVRAGGQQLTEGVDYTIDYNIGRIKILNEAYINSGLPIDVSFEDNTLFGFQTKTMVGLRADYKISDDFNIGGTFLKLYERPFTQKVNIGDDPINNNIYGGDIQYTTKAPWLTRAIDALPLIQTKEESQISFMAEGAYLDPGHASAISQENEGISYLDDFEGSTSSYDLRIPANQWTMASVPQSDQFGNNDLFPESELVDSTLSGVNRAKLSWYQIDQTGLDGDVDKEQNYYTQQIAVRDIFPNTQTVNQGVTNNVIRTLDLHYQPDERGPYNFDLPGGGTPYSAGMGNDGKLLDPSSRWAGIQRELPTNDFQAANVEFIEFWMMSPFLEEEIGGSSSIVSDGDLYINLGNVSEDVLRDSRLSFENADIEANRDQTAWGEVPRTQAITRAFENDTRDQQDVGLDGVNDEAERTIFAEYLNTIQSAPGLFGGVKDEIFEDVANDNFVYYNDAGYGANDDVFTRYSKFNNPEGNSKQSDQQVESATNIPDTEDINRNNTLDETETYYQYHIPLRRSGTREVEENQYLVERLEVEEDNSVWYRFKIPVDQFTDRVGGIQDFRSIRFIRMYMTGFDTPVTLRFARFELVRNTWRRYLRSLEESGIGSVGDEDDETLFDVNEVNLEENSLKAPYNYVMPPGVEREQQVGSPLANAFQNEQSLAMNICNLQDGDARAIFKNLNLDLRLFKRLKMFVHAESDDDIEPGKLSVFMRIGSDFEKNYYEYEIPLTMTTGVLDPNMDDAYREAIWPEENEFDFALELLRNVKIQRNQENFALNTLYSIDVEEKPGHRVGVKGNPNMGLVKSIMVGVRNTEDDGLPLCTEVWLNELRMSGFDERGGWGALARLDVQMADFGTFNASTNYTSVGFGGLEQKLAQRSREEVIQYDFATNLELGKFLPEKSGIKIPVYAQYSTTIKNPQYDPYDYDIELKDNLRAAEDKETRDSLKEQAQDYTNIRSVNLTNVRKERTKTDKTPMPWDVENFSLTYAYSKSDKRTPIIAKDQIKDHQGIIDYNYTRKVKYFKPFKNLVKKDGPKKYLKFITDFNFNPMPNSFAFSTKAQRQFQTTTYRFASPTQNTWYNKQFTWDRIYDFKWDLSKSLKFNFDAKNYTVIDEPEGLIDTDIERDSIWTNVRQGGRNKLYEHNVNVSYNVPLKNFPFLDFIQLKAQYNASFGWQAAALNTDSLGNIVKNNSTRQINGDLDFTKLYNKSKYLKKINSKKSSGKGKNKGVSIDAGKLGKDKGKPKDDKSEGKDGKDKKKEKDKEPSAVARTLLRPLMMLRKARFTYSEKYSSIVPGVMPQHRILGMDNGWNSPGWDYVFGLRQPSELWLTSNKEWFSPSVFVNQQVLGTYTQDMQARVTIEPFRDFKIDLEADRKITENSSAYFKRPTEMSDFEYLNPQVMGSFSVSYYTLGTMFTKDYDAVFEQFQDNREIISRRLAERDGNLTPHELDSQFGDYYEGYGRTNLDVLVPSFLAAYNGKSAQTHRLDVFKTIPLPNWRLTYNGLAKLKGLNKIFTSININHSYQSGLTVNSFRTDLDFDDDNPQAKNENTANYYSTFEIPNLVISEQFSPLLGLDIKLKNGMSTNLDWKKSRNLSLSFTDSQLSESRSDEFVVGFGYRMKNVYIPWLDFGELTVDGVKKKIKKNKGKDKEDDDKDKKKKKKKGNDLNFKFDFSWRDDVTINHILDQNVNIETRGMKTIRISPSIDYDVNKQLNLRLFMDYSKSIPATSSSPPITNTQAGLKIRFTFN